jgi:hypothetical protein
MLKELSIPETGRILSRGWKNFLQTLEENSLIQRLDREWNIL